MQVEQFLKLSKAIGDPRELETAMKLKKTQLRASGLNMSHELEGDMVEAKIDDKLRKDAKPIKGGGLYKSGMNKKVMGEETSSQSNQEI